ncbi:uncharacterized protein LOC114789271 [Denticeps clupeoides]|uniref:uncharacterized protein LOC114789271 n=1 Tax=Denticeps clupeoides TaxID=299321 RepID=UPI0010A4FF9C|nr:uncharacterized protein LOC114789271 [Denticeps clupeoides]
MEAIEPIKMIAETLITLFQKEQSNKEQCKRLANCITTLVETLTALQKQDFGKNVKPLEARLAALKEVLDSAEAFLKKWGSTNKLFRFFKANKTEEKLQDLFQQLEDERKQLCFFLQVEQRDEMDNAKKKLDAVNETVKRTEDQVTAVHDVLENTNKTINSVDEEVGAIHNEVKKMNDALDNIVKRGETQNTVEQKHSSGAVQVQNASPSIQDSVQLLDKIRPEFVRGVSAAVINLLLDDLQQDRVLNALEVESIREENPARADKARVLIKLVLNKGKKSSEKMINHLIKHDPDFSATLGLC